MFGNYGYVQSLRIIFLQNHCTKIRFSMKYFFSKCDQIRRKFRIWLHLPRNSLMENFMFFAVNKLVSFFSDSSAGQDSHQIIRKKSLMKKRNIANRCYSLNNKDIQLYRRFRCTQNLPTASFKCSGMWSCLGTEQISRCKE